MHRCAVQGQEALDRKTDALFQIATAGSAVEEAIAKYADELDAAAVRLLERRLETAQKCVCFCNSRLPIVTGWCCMSLFSSATTASHAMLEMV